MKFNKKIGSFFLLIFILSLGWISLAPIPQYRLQHLFFGNVLPVYQAVKGLKSIRADPKKIEFTYENPAALADLRRDHHLDDVVKTASNDFAAAVMLMHWARDQYPHGEPEVKIGTQNFDGNKMLADKRITRVLCGHVSQLLVQAIQSFGGYARRVELRFTPGDTHAVTEFFSKKYNRWIILDPDYDVYYMRDDVPLNALEIHNALVEKNWKSLKVHFRMSDHNIYEFQKMNLPTDVVEHVVDADDWKAWDRDQKKNDYQFYLDARFAVRLSNYYHHFSYPLRTDWLSRPLPWFAPDGNHVQNSAVIDLPTIPSFEDFLINKATADEIYAAPPVRPADGPFAL